MLICSATCVQFGINAKAGPLEIFISRKNIPADQEWQGDTDPAFVAHDAQDRIERNVTIRCRIVGWKADGGAIYSIGSLTGNFLGTVS